MKKIVVCVLILLLLCGCKTIDINEIYSELDQVFDNLESLGAYRINNNMTYYSYYLPSDIGEDELDSDSVVLKYGESKIIMNLNVSNIVNARYYSDLGFNDDGFFVSDNLVYEKQGMYNDYSSIEKNYLYRLYDYDGQYVLHLKTSDMNYYGSVSIQDIKNVTRHLMIIAKNTNVSYEQVLADFANKDVIDYQRKQIDLFDNSLPSSGELASMLIDSATIGDINNNEQSGQENDGKQINEESPQE